MRPKIVYVVAASLLLVLISAAMLLRRMYLDAGTKPADSLRVIYIAEITYAGEHPDKGFAASLSALGPNSGEAMIDGVLASGMKSGYAITLIAAPPDAHGRVARFAVVARPARYSEGLRSFFIDESGVEHFTREDRAPNVSDPIGGPLD